MSSRETFRVHNPFFPTSFRRPPPSVHYILVLGLFTPLANEQCVTQPRKNYRSPKVVHQSCTAPKSLRIPPLQEGFLGLLSCPLTLCFSFPVVFGAPFKCFFAPVAPFALFFPRSQWFLPPVTPETCLRRPSSPATTLAFFFFLRQIRTPFGSWPSPSNLTFFPPKLNPLLFLSVNRNFVPRPQSHRCLGPQNSDVETR